MMRMRFLPPFLKNILRFNQPSENSILTEARLLTFSGRKSTYCRYFSRQILSKNVEILSADKLTLQRNRSNVPIIKTEKERPMVLMLAWMLAKHKHLKKYVKIYIDKGYDVMTVSVTPWQLIWPLKGAQLIADDVLQFIDENKQCSPLLIHGFSVGGYLWGEVLVRMNQDLNKHKPLIDRIIGQIWDSAADITEIQKGLPNAVFPKNSILRSSLEKYIGYHMKTFYDGATQHYIRSSQMFHTTPVRAPALMFVCKTDPIGSTASNSKVRESWDSMGMQTYWKCWDESKHVSHFLLHRDEYLETLNQFLESLEKKEETKTEETDDKQIQRRLNL